MKIKPVFLIISILLVSSCSESKDKEINLANLKQHSQLEVEKKAESLKPKQENLSEDFAGDLTPEEKAEAREQYGTPFFENPYFDKKDYKLSKEEQICIDNAEGNFINLSTCINTEREKTILRITKTIEELGKNSPVTQKWIKNEYNKARAG